MLRPLMDRVIVQPLPEEKMSKGGVVLPDTAGEKPQRGTVIARGPAVEGVEKGAEVLYSRYGGTELVYQGDDLLVLRMADVLAVVE